MKSNKIIVLFPGVNYGGDCPLLYYAGEKFEAKGYEKVNINYDKLAKLNSIDECIDDIEKYALIQLENYDFNKYDDIVFVSKSIGTVVAGWIEEKLHIKVRHILLTPIEQTLPYINEERNIGIVIAGTKDKFLNSSVLKEQCKNNNINFKEIIGVGHRLEFNGDVDKSISLLKEIVELY